ncbi:MAG TPA: hypothetical protein VEA37_01400 [Flavobacterium sp.]|nr:hypothetical protein [Flavobacterium sp.]
MNTERFNRYEDWKEYAEARGYQIEPDGSGNHVAHKDGDEKGIFKGNYGGCHFGWFY